MMKSRLSVFLVTISALVPTVVFGAAAPTDFRGFVSLIVGFIGILVGLVFTLTFIVFIWGIIKAWIINGYDTKGIEDGKNVVINGIIAFTIMISIWGILYMLRATLFGN